MKAKPQTPARAGTGRAKNTDRGIEALESRRMFSVTVSQGYPGVYEIDGTDDADTINVSVSQADASFTLNGVTYTDAAYLYVYGRGGDDVIHVTGSQGDIGASIDGGDGNDDISLNFDGSIWAGAGNDTVHISDAFEGEVYGEAGDDNVYVSGECIDPTIDGGDGNDLIDASGNHYGVTIHGGAGNDTIYGSAYADQLYGDGGCNTIYGLAGNDTIYTRNGYTDRIDGGDGNDSLYGDMSDRFRNVESVTLQ